VKPHLRLFGIPVRFDLSFLFLLVGFGYLFVRDSGDQALVLFLLWIPIVTSAILLHELGHALTGRAFGLEPAIVLHGMGGLTQFPMRELRALSHWRRISITAAGPLAGIVVGAVLGAIWFFSKVPAGSALEWSLSIGVFTTLGWGVLNLAPVLPLDGGHIVATFLEKLFGPRGLLAARMMSIVVAVALGAVAAAFSAWFLVIMLGLFALMNWRAYRVEKSWQQDEPLTDALRRAQAALEARDTATVRDLADAVLTSARTPQLRAAASHLLAWAYLLEGEVKRAREALERVPGGRPDAFLEGSVYLASGEPSRALAPLVEALVDRGDDEVADAVADAAAGAGRADELVGLIESEERAKKTGLHALQRIGQRLYRRGAYALSSEIHGQLFARFGDAVDAFNAACAAVRAGAADRALELLARAIEGGLAQPSLLDSDEDLGVLRGDPRFEALRARAGLV
jgi:Zn-dependent protease